MTIPELRRRPTVRRARARRAPAAVALLAGSLVASGLGGCLRKDRDPLTIEEFTRERAVRERTLAKIEADHEALTDLIQSARFDDPDAVYGDPELRALALHLIEQSKKLERLSDSDVLAPEAP